MIKITKEQILAKFKENGNGIYIYIHRGLNMDTPEVYVVNNGEFVKGITPPFFTLYDSNYYNTIGVDKVVKLCKDSYPEHKVYVCNVSYSVFRGEFFKDDNKDSFKLICDFDEVINVL